MRAEPRQDLGSAPTPEGSTPLLPNRTEATMVWTGVVRFLERHGFVREEKGSGWFFHPDYEEGTLGTCLEMLLDVAGLDTREVPPGASDAVFYTRSESPSGAVATPKDSGGGR